MSVRLVDWVSVTGTEIIILIIILTARPRVVVRVGNFLHDHTPPPPTTSAWLDSTIDMLSADNLIERYGDKANF